MPRTLDGVDDRIGLTPTAITVANGFSMAAVVRRAATGNYHTIFYRGNNGGFTGGQPAFGVNNSNVLYLEVGGSARNGITIGTGHWLVAVTKAAGTATPRFHAFDLDAPAGWTHTNGAGTIASPATAAQSIEEFGRWNGSSGDYWNGDLAAFAMWDGDLGDIGVERLLLGQRAWVTQPFALVYRTHFHQDPVANVPDLVLGTRTQANVTGTAVASASTPLWRW